MSAEAVTLRHGRHAVVVQGGTHLTLSSWTVDRAEVLVSPGHVPADYRVHGERAGVTFLHPWANRVHGDVFTVAGREVRLTEDPGVGRDPDGVALHGLAAPGAWVPRADGTVLRDVPATPGFPFAHRVEVAVTLDDDGVAVTTTVTAPGDGPLPVAFGWHPYLRVPGKRRDWVLGMPGSDPAPLGDRTFDDGFGDAGDTAWSIGPVTLRQDAAYGTTQVFAPGDCDVVSLEPMTAPADALRTGDGLVVLPPGAAAAASFALTYQR